MKKTAYILLLLAPLACASEPLDVSGDTEGVGSSTSTAGDTGSTDGSTTGTGSETGDETGSETGGETGSETGSETGTDTGSTGDGDGDGDMDLPPEDKMDLGAPDVGDGGEDKFPGDDCDPFIDECLDQGGDFECQQNLRLNDQNQSEVYFECTELNMDWGDGMYASQCHIKPYEQCTTGFWCRSENAFPANTCAGPACCIELCYFGQDCGGGDECVVDVWQADLADYLDQYDGIGHCP